MVDSNKKNFPKGPRTKARRIQKVVSEELATRIVDLYVREELTQTQIAERVGKSQPVVANIISARKEEWRERRAQSLGEWQDAALAKLRYLQSVAWKCFELSRLPYKETQAEQERRLEDLKEEEGNLVDAQANMRGKGRGNPGVSKVLQLPAALRVVGEKDKEVMKFREEGNPKFLDIVRWCYEVELKMCGLLTTTDLSVDNRQGVFVDLWQKMVTPPPVGGEPQDGNPVAARLAALVNRQPKKVEAEVKDEPSSP